MQQHALYALVLLLFCASGWGNTYWVGNVNDAGAGSLRQAIADATGHVGRDVIRFRPRLAGRTIYPATQLPPLTDHRTIIEGDIDGDGAPDITLNGTGSSGGHGLYVSARYCTISGLAIIRFPGDAVHMMGADFATIRSCHVGVTLNGNKQGLCGQNDLYMKDCDYCTIGGPGAAYNVFSGGGDTSRAGIVMEDGNSNTIAGNYFNIRRDGSAVIDFGYVGIDMSAAAGTCSGNIIGGLTADERNVFGRLGWGVKAENAVDTTILGNYFGLLPNGSTQAEVTMNSVTLDVGCADNLVGGTTPEARNVFVGSGIDILDGAGSNAVRGNYFGFNAAGTQQRDMAIGVRVRSTAPQTIGGGTAAAGNWFAAQAPSYVLTQGVALGEGGEGSIVKHNHFGTKPAGGEAFGLRNAIGVRGVAAEIDNNWIANASRGISVALVDANPVIRNNTIRDCGWAVEITDQAQARLGNLGNASTADDGGNYLRPSNAGFIWNGTPNRIYAEGNDFGTTVRTEINAKIEDVKDNASYGRVDFSPLMGGVLPTEAILALTGAAAAPNRAGGAEIVFSLSAGADVSVTVLNMAGRPVATVCRDRATEAGTQRLVWSGRSDRGTAVPSGVYLVSISARSEGGAQARALARLAVQR